MKSTSTDITPSNNTMNNSSLILPLISAVAFIHLLARYIRYVQPNPTIVASGPWSPFDIFALHGIAITIFALAVFFVLLHVLALYAVALAVLGDKRMNTTTIPAWLSKLLITGFIGASAALSFILVNIM